jgi:hypothetical protein
MPTDDPLHQSRLDALRAAVAVGVASAQAERFVDGRVVEHELREELDRKLEQRQRRKAPGSKGA